jgi:hypothetical protein
MGLPDVTGEELRTWGILLALVALGLVGAIFHSRQEWRALRHKLYKPLDGLKTLSRPSRLAQRLTSDQWYSVFRETLTQSGHDFQTGGNSAAAAAMEAVGRNAEPLAPLVQEVALGAMIEGELRSALVRLDEALVYILVFPGRHEDKRTFRRSEAFAEGWQAHAAAVHSAADARKTLPMISLLFFLGLDAQSGTLLAAYDGEEGSLFPTELAEPANGKSRVSGVPGLCHDFVLV